MLPNWSQWLGRLLGELLLLAAYLVAGLVALTLCALAAWAFTVLITAGLRRRHDRACDRERPEEAAPLWRRRDKED